MKHKEIIVIAIMVLLVILTATEMAMSDTFDISWSVSDKVTIEK